MVIATLGNINYPSTCSYLAAKEKYPDETIILLDRFEKCLEEIKKDRASISVIPAAYPNINEIIMNDDFKIIDVFLYVIPDLVLSCKNIHKEFNCLYYHKATESLLSKVLQKYDTKISTSSNTASSLKVRNSLSNDLCITNRVCSEQQSLVILQELRKELNIPFICFAKKGV